MTDKPNGPNSWERINLGSEGLKKFFLAHLDRIYIAKVHLIAKLPELAGHAQFADLKHAITDAVGEVQTQLARIQMIYMLLDAEASAGSIHGVSGLIDDAYEAILQHTGEPELQDLSIIFYLQNIESIQMSSFQVLQMAAVKFKNDQINSLLSENYQEAKADRALLLLISSKYITS